MIFEHDLRDRAQNCEAGTDVALSVRIRMKTQSNVLVRRILKQIVQRTARRARAQQDCMRAVSRAVGFKAEALEGPMFDKKVGRLFKIVEFAMTMATLSALRLSTVATWIHVSTAVTLLLLSTKFWSRWWRCEPVVMMVDSLHEPSPWRTRSVVCHACEILQVVGFHVFLALKFCSDTLLCTRHHKNNRANSTCSRISKPQTAEEVLEDISANTLHLCRMMSTSRQLRVIMKEATCI